MLSGPRYRHILRSACGIVTLDNRQDRVIACRAEHINIGVRSRNRGAPGRLNPQPRVITAVGTRYVADGDVVRRNTDRLAERRRSCAVCGVYGIATWAIDNDAQRWFWPKLQVNGGIVR